MDQERNYKAFISYRHLPLEKDIAKKLHRRIEHYVIPTGLRKNGEKKLGYVFRDQEELPISGNLSENIQNALNRSEYLIVICSPETVKSAWVRREISFFLEKHDRNHILTVLADGSAEDAFPPEITDIYSTEGKLLQRVEPLAANVVADSAIKRNVLLRTESLRILAALIGCPFDALYRREQRYRRKRAVAALTTAAVLVAAFIGMLLNRNAEIQTQLSETQRNESIVLAQLAKQEYSEGNYHGAVEHALRALPDEMMNRPYVPEAELVLNQILHPYQIGGMAFDQSFEQTTSVKKLLLSDDGKLILTADDYGSIRCFDCHSGVKLWERQFDIEPLWDPQFEYSETSQALFFWNYQFSGLYKAHSGEVIWKQTKTEVFAVDAETSLLLSAEKGWNGTTLRLQSLKNGETISILENYQGIYKVDYGAVFPNKRFAVFLAQYSGNDDYGLSIWDTGNNTITIIDQVDYNIFYAYQLCITGDNRLLMAYDTDKSDGEVRCYDPEKEWKMDWASEFSTAESFYEKANGYIGGTGHIDVLQESDGYVTVGGFYAITRLDMNNGDLIWKKQLRGAVIDICCYKDGRMCVLLDNGLLTQMTKTGNLYYEARSNYFDTDMKLKKGMIQGDNYQNTVTVIVPTKYPNHMSVVRRKDGEQAARIEGTEKLMEGYRRGTSPSGEKLAFIEYDRNTKRVKGEVWDLSTGERIRKFSRQSEYISWLDPFVMTESGMIIIHNYAIDSNNGLVYDLSTEERKSFSSYDYAIKSLSIKDYTGERILSAILDRHTEKNGFSLLIWENGEKLIKETTAFPMLDSLEWKASLLAVGGDGSVLLCAEERYGKKKQIISYSPLDDSERNWETLDGTGYAMGERVSYLAVQRSNGMLELYDTTTGALLWAVPAEQSARSVTKLLFAGHDNYLLAFTESGMITIYKTDTGECLYQDSFKEKHDLSFSEYNQYDVFIDEERDRLLIKYNYDNKQSFFAQIDRKSWICTGSYLKVLCYVSSNNELILFPEDETSLRRTVLLDTEGLQNLAREYLEREPKED